MAVIRDHQVQGCQGRDIRGSRKQSRYFRLTNIPPSRDLETPKSKRYPCYASPTFSQANGGPEARYAYHGDDRAYRCALSAVPHTLGKSDYVSVGTYPFALRLATSWELYEVRRLARQAADSLRATQDTDQWAKPWPDRARQRE